jgi:hypothetical protein
MQGTEATEPLRAEAEVAEAGVAEVGAVMRMQHAEMKHLNRAPPSRLRGLGMAETRGVQGMEATPPGAVEGVAGREGEPVRAALQTQLREAGATLIPPPVGAGMEVMVGTGDLAGSRTAAPAPVGGEGTSACAPGMEASTPVLLASMDRTGTRRSSMLRSRPQTQPDPGRGML